jgi:pentatricopeptide repeat protein
MAMVLALQNPKKKTTTVLFVGLTFSQIQLRRVIICAAEPQQTSVDKIRPRDVRDLCKQGRSKEAFQVLNLMEYSLDSDTCTSLLYACIVEKALPEGKLIHAHVNARGFMADRLLGFALANMYAKCGSLSDARKVFDELPERDVRSWTVMIAAYSRHGFAEEALALFRQMQHVGIQPDEFVFSTVLPVCAELAAVEQGMKIHREIIRRGFHRHNGFVGSALVDMYARCGRVDSARDVFDKLYQRDVVSWTAMIAAYAQNGQEEEALKLFQEMQMAGVKPNAKTFANVLPACTNLAALERGLEIHGDIIRNGFQSHLFVESALINMYAKCGNTDIARNIFDIMPQRDSISWTVMIAGYAHNGQVDEALKLFQAMPERNIVSWTSMISGYAQNGHSMKALRFFQQIQSVGIVLDSNIFASVLPACANLAAVEHGMQIHEEIIRSGFHSDVTVVNALIDMYAKCGSIEKARELFNKMYRRTVVTWTSIIAGYAIHGCGKEALKLFQQMECSDISPNHITLVCVLSACCHAGMVNEGYHYFNCMSECYGITPVMEHYSCMVDLLGRAGRLDEAHDFINKMPIKPDAMVLGCLLGACRMHNNIELAEHVTEQLFELEPKNSAPYVLLSNIYAAAGRWTDMEKVQKMMKDRGVKKTPGCSWIEVNKQVHTFLVGDRSHPQMQNIYKELERLSREMKAGGYAPFTRLMLNDVEEEQNEEVIFHHSEKLAIVIG